MEDGGWRMAQDAFLAILHLLSSILPPPSLPAIDYWTRILVIALF